MPISPEQVRLILQKLQGQPDEAQKLAALVAKLGQAAAATGGAGQIAPALAMIAARLQQLGGGSPSRGGAADVQQKLAAARMAAAQRVAAMRKAQPQKIPVPGAYLTVPVIKPPEVTRIPQAAVQQKLAAARMAAAQRAAAVRQRLPHAGAYLAVPPAGAYLATRPDIAVLRGAGLAQSQAVLQQKLVAARLAAAQRVAAMKAIPGPGAYLAGAGLQLEAVAGPPRVSQAALQQKLAAARFAAAHRAASVKARLRLPVAAGAYLPIPGGYLGTPGAYLGVPRPGAYLRTGASAIDRQRQAVGRISAVVASQKLANAARAVMQESPVSTSGSLDDVRRQAEERIARLREVAEEHKQKLSGLSGATPQAQAAALVQEILSPERIDAIRDSLLRVRERLEEKVRRAKEEQERAAAESAAASAAPAEGEGGAEASQASAAGGETGGGEAAAGEGVGGDEESSPAGEGGDDEQGGRSGGGGRGRRSRSR